MRCCFLIAVAFAMALLIYSPISAEEVVINGDFETVTAGTPYDTFDGWIYGWQDTTDGSIMPSTDSVISGERSVKIGFTDTNWHGQISQDVETGTNWEAELDFAILTETTRALGVNICIEAEGSTDDKERITIKTDGGNLYVAGGPDAVGGWSDLGLTNALETAGSVWNGQTPVVNHLVINGYLGEETPYYTVSLNGETSDPITYWSYGTGTVVRGTVMNMSLTGAYGGSGGGGDLNTWLADNVSLENIESLPGDANGDGMVDGSDVTILAGNWQILTGATWEMGDFNGDGKVDGSDVTILAGNWQAGVTPAASAVPEPNVLILLTAGMLSALFIRFKRNAI